MLSFGQVVIRSQVKNARLIESKCASQLHGGLEILNLDKFAITLRLRWLWGEWLHPDKPWVGLGTPCDDNDRNIFAATIKVQVGNGLRPKF